MIILAIETSCDETSAAVTQNNEILSNVISSQVDLHKKWGGVVPDIARRAHKEQIEGVIKESLKISSKRFQDLDYIAVTYGPGLAIALEVGITKAKELAHKYNKPLAAVNHMEAHLLSSFALNSKGNHPKPPKSHPKNAFPSLGLVVSGGHTDLVHIDNFGKYKLLGQTLDDAAGEAFDKVAKMLDLGYPGGPIISEFAKKGENTGRFGLPIPMENSGDLNFSYSGLKTACLYKIKEIREKNPDTPQKDWIYDFCAEFVDSVIKSVQIKISKALELNEYKQILIGGGVISNTELRRGIRKTARAHGLNAPGNQLKTNVYQPYSNKLFTDNAGMIGTCAYHNIKYGYGKLLSSKDEIAKLDRVPTLGIEDF